MTRLRSGGGDAAQVAAIAPFLEEDDLDRVVRAALNNAQPIGKLSALFPYLSRETLRDLAGQAVKRNDMPLLPELSAFL